jgi:cholesterol transport system auxiliary component
MMTPPLSRRGMLGAAAWLVSLAGCSLLLPTPAPQLYRLTPQSGDTPKATPVRGQLVVGTPVAPESLDTEKIALTRDRTTLDYFAGAAWTDRVPLLLQGLMIGAFEDSGQIVAVGRDSSDINADYRLETDLRDFQARYTGTSDSLPTVVVRLDAKLVRMPDRKIVDSVLAEKEVQAMRNDLNSIVEAFDRATGEIIAQMVGWTLRIMSHTR